MIKVLKTMWSDIAPKSFKSLFDGFVVILVLLAIIAVVTLIFMGICVLVALVMGWPLDMTALAVSIACYLFAWVFDAWERS